MVGFIIILVGIACAVTIISLFLPAEGKQWQESHNAYQDAMERTLRQLKDQLFTLEMDVKKTIRLTTGVHKEVQELREKESAPTGKSHNMTATAAVAIADQYVEESIQLREAEKKIRVLTEENKKLGERVTFLTVQLDEVAKERQEQERIVGKLRVQETGMRERFAQMQAEFEDLKRGLEQVTRGKLEIKDQLFKLKVISADNDKELERLRSENKELMDHLSYERNS